MKKFTAVLWIIILTGIGFIAYDYLKPQKQPETYTVEQPSSTKTPLQQEVEKESAPINKNFSGIVRDGDKLAQSGYLQEAAAAYKQALSLDPSSEEVLFKLGTTYFEDNKPQEARMNFSQLKEIKNTIQTEILIGRTYLNSREIENAKKHFDSLDQTNEDVKYYTAIIKILYKKNAEAQKDLTFIASSDTFSKEIKAKAQTFVDAYKTFYLFKEGQPQHLEALLSKAFIDTEEFSASIPLLYDIIKLQNNYRDAWIMLGYSYLQTGKNEDAVNALLQAESLDPAKSQTLFFLGLSYAVEGKYDNAIDYFTKAEKAGFEPKSLIEQKLADIYLIKKEYQKAIVSYSNIINQGLIDKNIFTKVIWICIEKTAEPEKALELSQKLIKALPEDPVSYNLRGWSYVAYGDYDRAKEDLLQALKLNPNYDSAYLNLGWMYEKENMPNTAKEYYKKAYTLGNGNSISNLAAIRFNNIMKADISSPYSQP